MIITELKNQIDRLSIKKNRSLEETLDLMKLMGKAEAYMEMKVIISNEVDAPTTSQDLLKRLDLR